MLISPISIHGMLKADYLSEEARLAFGQLIDAQVEALTAILNRIDEQVTTIEASKELTPMGKRAAKERLGRTAIKELETEVSNRRRVLDAALEKAKRDLPQALPNVSTFDPVVQELRYTEIRRFLMAMDPLMRGAVVHQAADSGDIELLLAVQSCPKAFDLVEMTTLQEATKKWLALNRAEQFQRLSSVVETVQVYDDNAKMAKSFISERAMLISTHDPIKAMATGGPEADPHVI